MKKTQKGFTIIEVALVLAVGAMIFLVVFLAVPALQRNSRNDGRKRDASSVVTAVETWASNNPTSKLSDKTGKAYEGGEAKSGTGYSDLGRYLDTLSSYTEEVQVTKGKAGAINATVVASGTRPTVIFVYTEVQCDGNTSLKAATTRSAAVVYGVETAAGFDYQCTDAN